MASPDRWPDHEAGLPLTRPRPADYFLLRTARFVPRGGRGMVTIRHLWRCFQPSGGRAALLVLVSLACGCKTGSWGAKPAWWNFGGTAPAGSALTAAPAFEKDPTKPSEAAKPYPTTTTPDGYALDGSTQTAPAIPAGSAIVEPAAVTYGTTVAARAEDPAAGYPTSEPAEPNPSVAKQVGPYASLQQPTASTPAASADPAAAAMAGFGAAPTFEAEPPPAAPAGGLGMPSGSERVADARGAAAWPAAATSSAFPAASAPPAADSFGGQDSRYQSTGSRFSNSGNFQPAAPPPTLPASQPIGMPATATPALEQLPAAPPLPFPASPATSLPGTLSPPARRPDPGYRPGGTSSYRPNRAILAGNESAVGPVQPVAYQLPASATVPTN